MRILYISDTHGFHKELVIGNDIDMIIHAGDFSNQRTPLFNSSESIDFLEWYDSIEVKHKVLIAGNHDTSIQAKIVDPRYYKSITYLEHESVTIEGINIFGSPYTPSFGQGWAYNVARHRISTYWEAIPDNTDILITHGPPKGILDLSCDYEGKLEYCGDKALLNAVVSRNIKYHVFGHIHNSEGNYNHGIRTTNLCKTKFINASGVIDGRFDYGLVNKGIILEYE